MRRHIDILLLPLSDHLVAELDTLTPDYMEVVGPKGLEEVGNKVEKHLKAYDPAWFLCSLFGKGVYRPLRLKLASAPQRLIYQLVPSPFFIRRVVVPVS
jgi:hypothetical protein